MGFTAIIASLVAILAVVWSFWNVKRSRKVNARLPPGPRGLPIVGYIPFLGTELHKKYTELAVLYGPIFKLGLGNKFCVVVSSPSLAKEVVRDQDTVFANRDPPIAALISSFGGNDIAWSPYGPEWRKLRKIFVRKIMSNASLDACYPLRKQEIKNTIKNVYENKIGKPTDIGQLSFSTSINVMLKIIWGGTIELGEKGTNLAAELKKDFSELMVLMGKPNLSDIFPVLSWFDVQGIAKRSKQIIIWFGNIIDSAIEQHMKMITLKGGAAGNDEKQDFIQFLLELKDHEDSATSITNIQLKGMIMDILVGGTDTTTTMVEWTMAELMQHPEVMKKVHQELSEVVGLDSSVEEFHLRQLTYLDAVVKETFRLHPPVPLLVPRCSTQSTTVGGYTIPKGTTVLLNIWAIHRDPNLWDNPLKFRPERFLNVPSKPDYSGNNFRYMPFGSGRRMCAGVPLAERMFMLILASLLHSFEWKLPYGTELDLSDKFGIVVKTLNPLIAIPTPRLSNSELYY